MEIMLPSPDIHIPVDQSFLQNVLSPYREGCWYLQNATIDAYRHDDQPHASVSATGEFRIED